MDDVLGMILAGGKGSRLDPLTRDRSKPAVPFGGSFRIIDFTLSNCINSGLRRILVATQYKSASLERHIERGWHFLAAELGEFVSVRPPEQRVGEDWYRGTADAVYQNIYTIERIRPRYLMLLSGDHVYTMDYRPFLQAHIERNADCSIACLRVPVEDGRRFGVMQTDGSGRITGFQEKPQHPEPSSDDPDHCLASMGIYIFNTEFLFEQLCSDANRPGSSRDFGKDIIPAIIDQHDVYAWAFHDAESGEPGYWRDVGTIESYYEANLDLISVRPQLSLYDERWPIRTFQPPLPPPKFIFNETGPGRRRVGQAVDSMVCSGSIVSGGHVEHSILGPRVRIRSFAEVRDSLVFDGVTVGRGARIRRAVIDKHVQIPDDVRIGYDRAEDLRRGMQVSESGIVIVTRDARFDSDASPSGPHFSTVRRRSQPEIIRGVRFGGPPEQID